MKIEMTEKSLELLMKAIEIIGYQPDYFESDDCVFAWSPDMNIYFSVKISRNENINPKIIIGINNTNQKYINKAIELIIFSQKNSFDIDFDFPQNYQASTSYIHTIFNELKKQQDIFSNEELSSIKQGWEQSGMSMYMLMHKHNLVDEKLKNELKHLGTFGFYQNLCE